MSEPDDQLIAEFNARRSEAAFAALVRQHVNLVFATALRQVGDAGAAEEITQNVFVALAQAAGRLGSHPTIAGWLHQTALNKSREWLRSELRRRRREQVAVTLDLARAEGDSVWSSLVPLLDEALLELHEPDRLAVILHFMEGQTFQEVGSALGIGEDTARKRVNRCLDQLTHFFRRRGFAAPALVAGAPLFTLSSHAAPAGLAASATTAGLAAAHSSTSTLTLIKGALKIMAWTKAKTAIVATVALLLTAGTVTVVVKETLSPVMDDKWFEWSGVRLAPTNLLVIRPTHFSPDHFSGVLNLSPGELGQRQSLKDLLLAAYRLTSMENGYSSIRVILPKSLPQGYYDYLITLPGDYKEQFQTKIKKQFGLVGRMETIETNVLLLKNTNPSSSGLKRSRGDEPWVSFDNAGKLCGTNVPVSTLAGYVENKLKIPVVDKTDLEGNYDFTLHYPLGDRQKDQNELRTSLLNELGLELVPSREPVEMLVVERAKN